jgi:hypothetical protein
VPQFAFFNEFEIQSQQLRIAASRTPGG